MSFQQRWSKIASLRLKHAMKHESAMQPDEEEGVVRPFKTMTRRLMFPAEFISDEDFEGPLCMLYPETSFRSLWEVMTAALIGLQATLIPLSIAFEDFPQEWNDVDYAMQAFFGLDILLTFNLAFYELGALITQRKAIAKRYLTSWFVFDILATFPNELAICGNFQCDTSNLSKSFRILRFFKMFRLVRLAKLNSILFTIEDIASSRMLAAGILVMKLVLILFFMAHWLACFWIFIGFYVEQDNPNNWISGMSLQDISHEELYVSALYWALTTTISVGYGDIKPMNLSETSVCLISMVLSSVVFAYLLGSVTAFVSQQTEHETAHRESFVTLSSYMKRKNIPSALRLRVKRYLNYLWERKKEQPIDEINLIMRLSRPLRTEIYALTRGPVMVSCSVFPERFSKQIQILSNLLVSEIFAPSDIVFDEGELSSSMYFIKSGEVDIYQKKTRSTYKVLEEFNNFGELAFFSLKPRCASAKCRFFTELMRLERCKVDEAFDSIPDAIATMQLIEDRLIEEDLSILEIFCYICHEKNHVAAICPQIVIMSDKEEMKRLWLESRLNTSKRINVNEVTELTDTVKKSVRNVRQRDYNIRNVIGIATHEPFKDLTLLKKARKYLKENALLDPVRRYGTNKTKPKFTLLFGHDSDQEEFEDTTPSVTFGIGESRANRPNTVLLSKWSETNHDEEPEVCQV